MTKCSDFFMVESDRRLLLLFIKLLNSRAQSRIELREFDEQRNYCAREKLIDSSRVPVCARAAFDAVDA